jgi:hypothetical protein
MFIALAAPLGLEMQARQFLLPFLANEEIFLTLKD